MFAQPHLQLAHNFLVPHTLLSTLHSAQSDSTQTQIQLVESSRIGHCEQALTNSVLDQRSRPAAEYVSSVVRWQVSQQTATTASQGAPVRFTDQCY